MTYCLNVVFLTCMHPIISALDLVTLVAGNVNDLIKTVSEIAQMLTWRNTCVLLRSALFLMILKIAIYEAETSIIVGSIRTILDIPHSSCTVAHWGTAGHGVGSLKTYPFMAGGLDSAANTIATCLYL